MTIYSITDVLNESIKKDQGCFENIERKRATIEFLEASSKHLLEKTKGLIDNGETKRLQFPEEYKQEKFIQQLPCQ